MRGERSRRAHHKVLFNGANLISARTENLKSEIVGGLEPEPVAEPGERDETLKLVISVRRGARAPAKSN